MPGRPGSLPGRFTRSLSLRNSPMPYDGPTVQPARPATLPRTNIRPKRTDMTTRPGKATDHAPGFVRLLDPPERRPEDMTSFDHLNATGSIHHLIRHFGNIETTIIAGERYISPEPTPDRRGLMAPDLLIAFNADPEAYRESNG